MKNLTLLFVCFLTAPFCIGQTFSDDFESYNSGDYLAGSSPEWTTWSGATGGTEDVQITTTQANSGANAIYFSSTTGGGPQDVVLPFGGEHNTGSFAFSAAFYIEAGKGAYFNFQENTAIGTGWAMNCTMENGEIVLDNGTVLATGSYTDETWFELRIDVNLSTNTWELFLDNISQGTFANPTCQVASLDLFPLGGHGFYIDDVSYTVTPYSLPTTNGAITSLLISGLASQSVFPSVEIRNLGTDPITSFDIDLNYNGNQYTENITGVNLASLDFYTANFTSTIPLIAGENNATATISNVNGNPSDDDPNDDSKSLLLDPVVPATGKLVVGEEGTGTWCGWCPRGAVGLMNMDAKYRDFWQGIAVHNGDIMTNSTYDAGLGTLMAGYPSAVVDRGGEIDPSGFENDFLERIVIPPVAFMSVGATYNDSTRELTASITADFQQCVSGDYKVACILVEDSVTGTTSDYNQSNYYSYQANNMALVGANGFDWQAATNPVPAALMQYDHVGRAISPSFDGLSGAYPDSLSGLGYSHTHTFLFNLDPSWDENQIHIIGIILDPSGQIDNAGRASIAEGELHGLSSDTVAFNPSAGSISSTIASTAPSVAGACDATASAVVTDGSPPLTYAWDDPANQTNATATGLCAGTYTVDITDCMGNADNSTITIEDPISASVLSLSNFDNIRLYPNPAQQMAFISVLLENKEAVSVRVYSFSGELVINRNYGDLNGGYTLPINTKYLSAGIYAISIQIGDMVETRNLVIN